MTTTIKAEDKKRKTVFRQLLDSPFNLTWKSVDQETNNTILDVLCSLLAPLASYRPQQSGNTSRKRKRKEGSVSIQHPLFINPPPLVSSLTIGFNPTTEHLESEIQNTATKRMRTVFVARGDTSSTMLYSHFPMMASMLPRVRLVSLTKGAEARLCETLKLKRVGVIGLMEDTPGAATLFQLVEEKVPRIDCPWNKDGETDWIPTRVKWVETISTNKKQTESKREDGKDKDVEMKM